MDIWFWSEEEGVEEVCDQNEEEDSGVDVPAFEDMLELGIELLKPVADSCHSV